MKKTYTKPQMVFDSFELSQSIAAGCDYISNIEWQKCAIELEGAFGVIFVTKENGCNRTPDENPFGEICYDVPSDDNRVFTS